MLAALTIFPLSSRASALTGNEQVMFIPGIAYDVGDRQLVAEVKAFVFEKKRLRGLTTTLSALLGVKVSALNPADKARLYARSQLFKIDLKSGKELGIKFENGSVHSLPKTKDGKVEALLTLKKPWEHKEIRFEVDQAKFPNNSAAGSAFYASPEGVSAIFDIDDTIKISNVKNKKSLIINTLTSKYQAVDEVRPIFDYIKNLDNISFHYVSASPFQLYPALQEFIEHEGFPKGSFHLRFTTDIHDIILTKSKLMAHKNAQIEKLFAAYPQRKFILVGDSGESDPEIYAAFKRKYPDRVILIAIHDLNKEGRASPRFRRVFQGISEVRLF